MIIIMSFRKNIVILMLILSLFLISAFGVLIWHLEEASYTLEVDDTINEMIQQIFTQRNEALLERKTDVLDGLYNKNVTYGRWAYEHALKKMKYLHSWSEKQGVRFVTINSHIKVRQLNKKGDRLTLILLVSTEYQYLYENLIDIKDSFRIGTYHSLDLIPEGEGWLITREWYTDPFADSLNQDEIKDREIKDLILSEEYKQSFELLERRIDAVKYADKFCGAASLPEYGFTYNSKYRNYNNLGGDCANFASQILYEGGKFRKNGTWNYERGAGSKAWVNAAAFNSYMLYSNRASLISRGTYEQVLKSSYKLLPGDYVAYERKGKVVHISVVTDVDSKGYALVNSHNSDRYRVPWDLGWSDRGIRFWLVRVHY